MVMEEGKISRPRYELSAEERADDLITQYYAHEQWERERKEGKQNSIIRLINVDSNRMMYCLSGWNVFRP